MGKVSLEIEMVGDAQIVIFSLQGRPTPAELIEVFEKEIKGKIKQGFHVVLVSRTLQIPDPPWACSILQELIGALAPWIGVYDPRLDRVAVISSFNIQVKMGKTLSAKSVKEIFKTI